MMELETKHRHQKPKKKKDDPADDLDRVDPVECVECVDPADDLDHVDPVVCVDPSDDLDRLDPIVQIFPHSIFRDQVDQPLMRGEYIAKVESEFLRTSQGTHATAVENLQKLPLECQ